MNKKMIDRLEDYLDSECDDYSWDYSWEWNEDTECCEVEISSEDRNVVLSFQYDEPKDDLSIELGEDSWYVTREFDQTIKYFWMLVAPEMF